MNTSIRQLGALFAAALLITGGLGATAHLRPDLDLEQVYAPLDRMLVAVATRLELEDASSRPDLHERVLARAKMEPRLAALAAAGETRRVRVAVELAPAPMADGEALSAADLASLGARWVDGEGGLIDLPG
ncbi:MAG: hypothetical protein AAF184_15155, partial [Pseudomonadota bacterium]